MAIWGEALTLHYWAWNTATGQLVTGDAANHTLRLVRDGSEAAAAGSAAEVNASTIPGLYKLAATAAEMQAKMVVPGGKSSTANVILIGVPVTTDAGRVERARAEASRNWTVATDWGGTNDQCTAMAVQSDGKVVVVGATNTGTGGNDCAVSRHGADGSLDTTFGTGGKVTTDFGGGGIESFQHVVVLSNQKILAVGAAVVGGNYEWALARFNEDGSLDTDFNTTGKLLMTFGGTVDVAYRVAVDANGKYLVLGGTGNTGNDLRPALARLNTDGTLDTTFHTTGKLTIDLAIGSSGEVPLFLGIQSTGKIVVGGNSIVGGDEHDFLTRYSAAGVLDTTFATAGLYHAMNGTYGGNVSDGVLDDADRILLAGNTGLGGGLNLARVTRFTSAGAPDATFGADDDAGISGTSTWQPFDNDTELSGIVVQVDGKLLVAGASAKRSLQNFHLLVARLLPDGGLDPTFGKGGCFMEKMHAFNFGQDVVAIPGRGVVACANSGDAAETNLDWVLVQIADPAGQKATIESEQVARFEPVGPGAVAKTVLVNNTATGLPLHGARVWVTTDSAGTNVVAGTLTTDTFGLVTFRLDPGTYYVWVADEGFTGTNPNPLVVA